MIKTLLILHLLLLISVTIFLKYNLKVVKSIDFNKIKKNFSKSKFSLTFLALSRKSNYIFTTQRLWPKLTLTSFQSRVLPTHFSALKK